MIEEKEKLKPISSLSFSYYHSFIIYSSLFLLLTFLLFFSSLSLHYHHDLIINKSICQKIEISSYIGLAISFPLVIDGLIDLSIQNLFKRWTHWGMLSSIIVPCIMTLCATQEHSSKIYLCGIIIGMLFRYIVLIINTLTVEFDIIMKFLILVIAMTRILFIFLWSTSLFYFHDLFFAFICEIIIILCDCFLIGLLLSLSRKPTGVDPSQQCLQVNSIIFMMLLLANLIAYLWNPSGLLTHLIESPRTNSTLDIVNYCIISLAIMLPNRISRRAAEDLNRLSARKREFVRYVSHEVRTPLNAVYVGLHVLFQDIKAITNNSDILGVIEEIKHSCNDAVNILDGLLHFNEIDEGNVKIKFAPVRLKKFMHSLVNPFFDEANRVNVTLKFVDDIGDESSPFYLVVDKLKIGMVIRSILATSIHMTPEKGLVEVTLSLIQGGSGPPSVDKSFPREKKSFLRLPSMDDAPVEVTQMLRVTIKDTGAGIPKEAQDTIFDDSAQFRPIDYQSGLGTALDLWVAKEYVRMHEGHIGVISDGIPGQGCIFYVDLKVTSTDDLPAAVAKLENETYFSYREIPKFGSNESLNSAMDAIKGNSQSIDLSERDVTFKFPYFKSLNAVHLPALPPTPTFFSIPSPKSIQSPSFSSTASTGGIQLQSLPKQNSMNKITPGDSLTAQGNKLSRALVVDDVPSNRKMLGRVIQPYFHEIEYAANGKLAVDLVQQSETNEEKTRFNVIFMDCNMPVMDGIEATKQIRLLGYRGRIFGVTGNALGEDMNEFRASGLDQVLTKPLNMEKFFQAMKDVDGKPSSVSVE